MTTIHNGPGILVSENDFPDEVVTRAIVRDVDLGPAGVLALITLDNGHDHTKPNTFGVRGLLALNSALDAGRRDCPALRNAKLATVPPLKSQILPIKRACF